MDNLDKTNFINFTPRIQDIMEHMENDKEFNDKAGGDTNPAVHKILICSGLY